MIQELVIHCEASAGKAESLGINNSRYVENGCCSLLVVHTLTLLSHSCFFFPCPPVSTDWMLGRQAFGLNS